MQPDGIVIECPHHSHDVVVYYAGYAFTARERRGHLREGRSHFDVLMSVPARAAQWASQGQVSGVLGQTLLASANLSTRPADFQVSSLLATDAPGNSFGSQGYMARVQCGPDAQPTVLMHPMSASAIKHAEHRAEALEKHTKNAQAQSAHHSVRAAAVEKHAARADHVQVQDAKLQQLEYFSRK